uniref:Methyltransferase domain-containing protein n=1 Tax=Stomoxys calcitrans TaxID=35570 RepID=A0A1I8PQ87_STOCA
MLGGSEINDEHTHHCTVFSYIASICLEIMRKCVKALKNTFDLLSPNGGDCVIVFFAFNTIFNACNELSTSPKWYPYTRGEDNFMLTFENSKDCKAEFSEMMKAAGFENIRVDMESTVYDYETEEGLKENMISVCHALDFIPESRHSEFMDELGDILAQLAAERLNTDPQRTGSILSADVIVAYGQKMSVNKI